MKIPENRPDKGGKKEMATKKPMAGSTSFSVADKTAKPMVRASAPTKTPAGQKPLAGSKTINIPPKKKD